MNIEFETEQEKPKPGLIELIATMRDRLLFRGRALIERTTLVEDVEIDSSDLWEDERRFRHQQEALQGRPSPVVELIDELMLSGSDRISVAVDLEVETERYDPDAFHLVGRRAGLNGMQLRLVDADTVREAFYDRVAETLAIRAHVASPASWTSGADTISSTNAGDDILCAKGWFLSTGAIVGQSTCMITKKPGRYSLGVWSGMVTRYHPHIFDLPSSTPIHLNLP